jgi:CheY-like chemotaxis protein
MTTRNILIVDDNQDFAFMLKDDLQKRGYAVRLARDGQEGLAKVEAEKPDLILLDIKMPKMDGYTFVRRLKQNANTSAIPLVILTSYEPLKDIFSQEDVADYFLKSADMEPLFAIIEKKLKTN